MMKCSECPDYRECSKTKDLRRFRQRCPKAKEEKAFTNADKIRAMTDEELADFMCSLAYARNTPWSDPFVRTFCDNCPTVECKIEETGQTMEFNECDFVDGKCPHGDDVVWWLRQPAEVTHNAKE